MTKQECVSYLMAKHGFSKKSGNKEVRAEIVRYVNSLSELPATREELNKNYMDYLTGLLGL